MLFALSSITYVSDPSPACLVSGVGQGHETAAGGASDNTLIREWIGGDEDPETRRDETLYRTNTQASKRCGEVLMQTMDKDGQRTA